MAILLLLLIPIVAMVLSYLAGKRIHLLEKISVTSSLLEGLVGSYIVSQVVISHVYSFLPYFSLDSLSAIILAITFTIGLFATCHGVGNFRLEFKKGTITKDKVQEAYLMMRLFLVIMYIAIMTANPLIMWIAVEGTTLSTVFLVNFFNRPKDLEAAWKFLIINSAGILLGLLGTLLFFTQGGTSAPLFMQWTDLLKVAHQMNPTVLKFAYVFIFIGYGTKMGIVPIHTWLPDAHSQAPSPLSALLSGALTNIAFLAILRFTLLANTVVGAHFSQTLFLFFGTLSIFIAGSVIYTQKSYKRLLAYSTIEHSGLMLLGFGFGGIGVLGSLLLMIYHGLGKALLFLLSSNVAVRYSSSFVAKVTGMLKILPVTSILYIIAFLFLTGIPPFGMFFSEFYIILGGFVNNTILAVITLLMLIFVFVGFFRSITSMVFTTSPEGIKQGESDWWTLIPVGILATILIVISVSLPPFLTHLLNESVALMTKTR